MPLERLWLGGKDGKPWDGYRFDTLDDLNAVLEEVISECRDAAEC